MNRFSDAANSVGNFFNVDSTVSASSNINADDVFKTKSALNAVGNYDVPNFGITDIPDMGMIDGLKKFQSNNGLKVDGVMKPGGPTESALGQTLVSSGVSTADLMEKAKTPSIIPDVPKPSSTRPQTSWSATIPVGSSPKPKSKVAPTTGLTDPLSSAPKGKMPTKKQWEDVAKLQQQKVSTAIIPQGDTVQQRIQSMMTDKRYNDKQDNRLREHVQKQFQNAYPSTVEYDETGKMVQPKAVIAPQEVEPFDPDGDLQRTLLQSTEPKPAIMDKINPETHPILTTNMVEEEVNQETAQNHSLSHREKSIMFNSDDEAFPQDFHDEFDFDPNGEGEKEYAIKNPIDGGRAYLASKNAKEKVRELYGDKVSNAHNNEADAFRHAYWSYLMTQEIGAEDAKRVGDGHERSRVNDDTERFMDLYNNRLGRQLALDPKNKGRPAEEVIQEAIKTGKLRLRPFRLRGPQNNLQYRQ